MSPGAINTLPSPPETHSSYFGSIHTVPAQQRPMATPGSSLDISLPQPMDTPSSRFRRGPSIGYHSVGLRDSRERKGSTGSKFLVIVVPPNSVAQEHGNLGHTLSSGPPHRLSQGLIMPLFPTMYGQLTAIAREFNFPSSAGICLYYCYSEHGVTMTPRLSDDIWQTIWGLNEPSEKRSPIAGKLEFDIDMAQARWYGAWLSSRHRDSTENALLQGPTTAPSLQFRGDNRFTFPPTASEDGTVDHHSPQQRSAPVITRHLPKKLSLVDRFDTPHVANTETRGSRASASPPTGLPLSSHILSPITQQEEPNSARLTLNQRVKSWRRSAAIDSPIDLESSTAEIVAAQSPEQSPRSQSSFHLEDYAFSISSAGPDDSTSIASYHQDYLPSVHLADRVNGSVCLTASYCTSPGPMSDFDFYYEPSEDARLPSPDIAWRMFEEAPPTPRTATSWGPPSPGSLALSFDEYTPSLDIAHRCYFSRPSTPGTATSWGAQSFDGAYSVASHRSAFSIHLCDRGEYSRPPTPQTATSWGPASCELEAPSPYRLPSPDVAHQTFEDAAEWDMRASQLDAWRRALAEDVDEEEMDENVAEEGSVKLFHPWGHSWPYTQAIASPKLVATSEPEAAPSPPVQPWAHSWPYRKAGVSLKTVAKAVSAFSTPASRVARAEQPALSKAAAPQEDAVKPWAHSWPYRKPASLKTVAKTVSAFALQKVPKEKRRSSASRTSSSISSPSEYPFFVLYPPVYPHFELYPPVAGIPSSLNDMMSHLGPVEMSSNSGYPSFVLYPPVYPHFELYPPTAGTPSGLNDRMSHLGPVGMSSNSGYPSFVLYPPVYPHFELYPPTAGTPSGRNDRKSHLVPVGLSSNSGYPSFVLYPPVYPYFDLYPSTKYERREASVTQRKPPINMSPNGGYPSFVIYPPVYPYFALYPPVKGETPVVQQKTPVAASFAGYPSFVLYPAGYPHNLTEIYPGVALSDLRKAKETSVSIVENPLSVFASYPSLCIYSPSYPHNVSKIYPTVQGGETVKEHSLPQSCRIELNVYPSLVIYSPVYPYNLESIYPAIKPAASKQVRHTESAQRLRAAYPYFDLYPAVYPHFNLYPGPSCQGPPAASHSVKVASKAVSSSYPMLVIYPSQYPHFDLYPPPAASMGPLKADSARSAISTRVTPGYPYFDLYPAVYPHFSIWPANPVVSVARPASPTQPAMIASSRGSFSAVSPRRLTPPPQRAPTFALPAVPTTMAAKRASPLPQPAPKQEPPPVPMTPTLRRASSTRQPASRLPVANRSPTLTKTVRILDRPRRTRSGRLTHSELHAMVMMEQRGLALDTLLEGPGPDESEISASLPAFIQNTEPSSTTSDAGPLRPFPIPSTLSLSRSSTLPLRRPRPVDPVDPNVRGSIYSPESVRSRGLRFNTMSTINLEQKSPGLSRRMSLWDKGNTIAETSSSSPATPATHSRKKSRDSIVVQRIRTFNAQS